MTLGQDCADQAILNLTPRERHRLFATAMVIMAGIDLIAKFYAGSDEQGKTGTRIRTFAEEFIFPGLPSADTFAEVLYEGCRNPLLHSFSLPNERFRIFRTTDPAT